MPMRTALMRSTRIPPSATTTITSMSIPSLVLGGEGEGVGEGEEETGGEEGEEGEEGAGERGKEE